METPAESVRARVSSVTFYNVTQTAGRWWAIWVVGIVPIKREDVETLIVVQACQPPLGGSLEPPWSTRPRLPNSTFCDGSGSSGAAGGSLLCSPMPPRRTYLTFHLEPETADSCPPPGWRMSRASSSSLSFQHRWSAKAARGMMGGTNNPHLLMASGPRWRGTDMPPCSEAL